MMRAALLGTLCAISAVFAVPASEATSLPTFDPSRSSSLSLRTDQPLRVTYADADTELSGFRCSDDVRLGNYKSRASFACFTSAQNQRLWPEMGNGVLGLGPKAQKRHDLDGAKLPVPLLDAMTGPNAVDSNAKGLPSKFAFMATKDAAELQMGGYVPGSIQGKMRTVQSTSPKMYRLNIKSIRIGDSFEGANELLSFRPEAPYSAVPALLDTGSPCIMLPNNREGANLLRSPYQLYQSHDKHWDKMYITVEGIDQGLEISRKDLEVEHHTFLDQAWGTTLRPCVMPVTWDMQPPHQTPIVLGAVFFRAFNVLFDNSRASATVPPLIGLGKVNRQYNPIGISDYAVDTQGGDGALVHRIFVQHTPAHIVSKGPEELGLANPNGHQFFAQLFVGTPAQPLRVVVDTGSPLFGIFVSPKAVSQYTGVQGGGSAPQGLAHRRPHTLHFRGGGRQVHAIHGQARANMNVLLRVLPWVGGVVLVLLLLFLKFRRQIMMQIYFATKPDMHSYR